MVCGSTAWATHRGEVDSGLLAGGHLTPPKPPGPSPKPANLRPNVSTAAIFPPPGSLPSIAAPPLAPPTPPSAAIPHPSDRLEDPISIDRSGLTDVATAVADRTEVTLSPPTSNAAANPEPTDLEAPALTSEELDLFQDPELGVIRVRNPLEDPELGILRIREQPDLPVAAAPPKIAFLTARFSLVNSDNVLLTVNDVGGLTGDTFYRPAISLAAYPSLGPTTVLIGSLDAGLQRYTSQPTINYDDWRVRLALRQGLSPRSYVQVGVTYQELLRAGGSRFRFFDNRAATLTLGRRDPIAPNLMLDSFYQVQWNDARSRSQTANGVVLTDFSRLGQTAGAYLGYTPNSRWHTGLSYQLNLIDYTTQERYDTIQQLLGQVVYSITPRVRLSLYGGWSFGRSSDPRINFNDTILGITIDATVPLF